MKRTNTRRRTASAKKPAALEKALTGINGFDAVTHGGLPRARTTLVAGAAGCGKTLFATQFLVRGALRYDEPGVLVSFEETPEDLAENVASLGVDLPRLAADGLLAMDHVRVERSEFQESGAYDLEGLFIRLGHAIDRVGAKRVALDTIETLFGGLSDQALLRAELRRLFRWLKQRGVTTVVTAERGDGVLTRHGLEEYISDCVISLDHRVRDDVSTRRMRIVKYRGSLHGTNEYPFLIDEDGISVLPVTTLGLDHKVSGQRVSTGVPRLDKMLGGDGVFRGSTVLVSGTPGSGKTSLAAHFADAAAARGERCLYFSFEESPDQIKRNMASIGLNLSKWEKKGLLQFSSVRPRSFGIETHLAYMHKLIERFQPASVVVDPMTSLVDAGGAAEAHTLALRLVDMLKSRAITALMTSISGEADAFQPTSVQISSIVDTWILLRAVEQNGERNRALYIIKSRGTAHSNQVREFVLTDKGVQLTDVDVGPGGVLTGTARLSREASERSAAQARRRQAERKRKELEHKRRTLELRIEMMRQELAADEESLMRELEDAQSEDAESVTARDAIARKRGADRDPDRPRTRKGQRR